ncbi:MAG: G5 domain-containing protein [Chloroflexota bacterium]
MKLRFLFVIIVFSAACQSTNKSLTVDIVDGDAIINVTSSNASLANILKQSGTIVSQNDEIKFHGKTIPTDFIFPQNGPYILQLHRAHTITLLSPGGETVFSTTADNVGQALTTRGISLFVSDLVDPPLATPIVADITVNLSSAIKLAIVSDKQTINVKTYQLSYGKSLASHGLPVIGLDKVYPEELALAQNGKDINIARVIETITLQEKIIPFPDKVEYSANLQAGEQNIIQPGESGMIISRIRNKLEDGKEISQFPESDILVKSPIERIVTISSKPKFNSIDTPSGQLQYWRAVQMVTTSYSPCRSGSSKCLYGTASGLPVKQGVVALTVSLYNQLSGSKVYIPGYGIAIIGDTGGGFPDGRLWIDLGYSDADYQSWSGVHTVYFLSPAPDTIPPEFK